MDNPEASPTWSTWKEIPLVCLHRPYLKRTIRIALIVGTILFVINQLDVVLTGRATAVVWFKSVLTFFVPFCVSNYGLLVAARRSETKTHGKDSDPNGDFVIGE